MLRLLFSKRKQSMQDIDLLNMHVVINQSVVAQKLHQMKHKLHINTKSIS